MAITRNPPRSLAADRRIDVPAELRSGTPFVWLNPQARPAAEVLPDLALTGADLDAAIADWAAFAPLIARLFPETETAAGRIRSDLLAVPGEDAARIAGMTPGVAAGHRVLVKCDHRLPVAGSIKARGGVFEIFTHARELAASYGHRPANLEELADDDIRALFAGYRILTGSTGNLGYSIGVAGLALGFDVEIHMSADARQWKKDRLAALGAKVVEHRGDYETAVAAARDRAHADPRTYFVDDEDSRRLFLGYAAAAGELCEQLWEQEIFPTPEAPLVVYLPCGVGGAPGGIAFGLKHMLGDSVLPVLVEPVTAPCVLLQLACGLDSSVSVYDIGLDNRTEADGLAVPRASMLACGLIRNLVAGMATVSDAELYRWLDHADRRLGLRLELSAAAGFAAVAPFLRRRPMSKGTHVVWATGGGLVPDALFEETRRRAAEVLRQPSDRNGGDGG